MEHTVQILSENLCNKIAAGEVVERPASVIKELVENSLDAGAEQIRIEVERGGKGLLRVIDDGIGMSRDDAFLCLERHATSKISSDDDLFSLQTLGFRGEALPSIAAVSRFTLRTRLAAALEGWEIALEGGTVKRAEAVGMAVGTTIEVRDLFFNTPARRKFLRRDETETGHIADVVSRLALARPQVQFQLVHNGRKLLEASRQTSLAERVASVLGRPLLKELIPLEVASEDGLVLQGLLSRPEATRSTAGTIYTYINGRYIRDRVVQHALLDGYRSLLVKGRYPLAVLFLTLDPSRVDVNVHPTKHEVRFQDQRRVHDFIVTAIRNTLRPSPWLQTDSAAPSSPQEPHVPLPVLAAADPGAGAVPPPSPPVAAVSRQRVQESLLAYDAAPQTPVRPPGASEVVPPPGAAPVREIAAVGPGPAGGYFSRLRIIGQFQRSYILCQEGDDLLLIDQHAAHERIGFERLQAEYRQGQVASQTLLFPQVLEFDFKELAALVEHLPELERLGFELEPFGGKAYALKAVPQILAAADALSLLRDVVGELVLLGSSSLVQQAQDQVLVTMACHRMVRANQTLTVPEISALLRQLDEVDFQGHCPHGRPVMQRLTLGDIERMFKRS